jgi:hypothetical protein
MDYLTYKKQKHENEYYVYLYLRENDTDNFPKGTPRYIGKGKGRRAWEKTRPRYQQKPLDNDYIVIIPNLTEEQAFEMEIDLIKHYGRKDLNTGCLYNLIGGGQNPPKCNWGDPTVRLHLSQKRKEMWQNPEFREKRLKALQSDEFRLQAKIKATGKKQSEETKQKRANALLQSVVAINIETKEEVIYKSINECAKAIGCAASGISNIFAGRKKTLKGYTFKKIENN